MEEGSKQTPDFAALAAEWAQALAARWTEQAGSEVRLQAPAVERIELGAPPAGDEGPPAVVVSCRLRGEDTVAARFLAPIADAVTLAALLAGAGPEQIEERATQELDGRSLEAFAEAMRGASGVLSRLLEEAGLPALESGDAIWLEAPVPETSALAQAAYRRARCGLAVKGRPEGRLDLLIPEALAAAWFEQPPELCVAGAGRSERSGPLFVFEPDAAGCERAEALADELGCPVQAVAGNELPEDWLESVAAASAAVVAWDLGDRPGLDIVETLARDHRTRGVPVYMGAKAPARAQVEAAVRAGARGFLLRPYDAADLERRISGGTAASPADGAE